MKTKSGRKVAILPKGTFVSRKAVPKASAKLVKTIKRVMKGVAETKSQIVYGGQPFGGGTGFIQTVQLYPATPNAHNPAITSTNSDIHALIPQIVQGVGDNQRIGIRISPKALWLDLDVSINPTFLSSPVNQNIMVVLYILQHKLYTDYITLEANNDFTKLLSNPQANGTVAFSGNQTDAHLPVASQYFKVCKKLVFPLRSDGIYPGTTTPATAGAIANNNSSAMSKRIHLNLVKHLPKTLVYPEVQTALGSGIPTNAGLFWCIGYYNMDLTPFNPNSLPSSVETQYTSRLTFKDV